MIPEVNIYGYIFLYNTSVCLTSLNTFDVITTTTAGEEYKAHIGVIFSIPCLSVQSFLIILFPVANVTDYSAVPPIPVRFAGAVQDPDCGAVPVIEPNNVVC
jgi:hypothetical protein